MNEFTNIAKHTGHVFEGATEPSARLIATVRVIFLSANEIGTDAFTPLMPLRPDADDRAADLMTNSDQQVPARQFL
ncbi:hypothetical protein EOA78_26260 [Mesorhizobium sp. M5C.F.Cr.IN.023.01.1.1]|uniref:hypothetical protein n=1 Tax=Mesorhizobium sp. M5C.F.Cr.IN.023.01.1.1 TaxID=2496768 RepID=UPI000FCC5648|nr:hypothetical protein [Mesorhizobium sp. M5C.F.Cr.IN.023.01.1.1]RUV68588.1 hypothetical protein EOA78_26260 [Mesorhizobium sp. M5C.F.Cr.IN.023.01.1.1]